MSESRVRGRRFVLGLLAACTLTPIADAWAQTTPSAWRWSITPYAWIASTKGRVGSGQGATNVDLSAKDLLSSVDIAIMAVGEGRHGRWLGRLDVFYVKISDDENIEALVGYPATLNVDQSQTMLSPTAGYTVYTRPNVTVDVLAGLRYWHVNTDLRANLQPTPAVLSSGVDWVDGIAGADIFATPWGPRWHLFAYGDIGAGGSDLTWQLLGGATYDITEVFSMGLVYRHLDVDYESQELINDVAMSGPAVSFGFRF